MNSEKNYFRFLQALIQLLLKHNWHAQTKPFVIKFNESTVAVKCNASCSNWFSIVLSMGSFHCKKNDAILKYPNKISLPQSHRVWYSKWKQWKKCKRKQNFCASACESINIFHPDFWIYRFSANTVSSNIWVETTFIYKWNNWTSSKIKLRTYSQNLCLHKHHSQKKEKKKKIIQDRCGFSWENYL